jgi:DNA repair photolyase
MSIIYEPKGRAREYSPLAANFYEGCNHGCAYCYAPAIRRITREDYLAVKPRRDILHELEKDCRRYAYSQVPVLFNFMGDPYCLANDTHRITRGALKLMLENHIPVSILTKGGSRSLQDMDIVKQFGTHIKIGATLTYFDPAKSAEIEPGAALPLGRLEALGAFRKEGVRTWASFEPVLDPAESLKIMEASIPFVDEYKVGKINNFQDLDKSIDWTDFLGKAVALLRKEGKPFYVKHDLRLAAPSIKLYGNETLPDEHNLKGWEREDLFS